ncbi:GRB2-related adaptor protein 2-like [Archocentrus centrarchus]|uniref:GRB2-related adaptor protein 2-like n=1 Tax=Archocentrus centrarchus TaxID=63155 RepID=UPI0011EA0BE3|nr:GRB2-related adaptor protein 2-like [Archocentrus centrarchus]
MLEPFPMEARGKFDFTAIADDELNFRQGDILKIIHYDDIWCTAEINGEEGLVPRNFLDIRFPRWFQEDATSSDAEELLRTKHVGEFVIRKCRTSPGNFCISIKYEHGMIHYRLLRDKKGHYFLWREKFTSLNKLVDFYRTNSISKSRIIYLNVDGFPDRGGPSKARLAMTILRVKAVCDFSAIHKDELNLNVGDVIEVLDMSDVFWWKGKLKGFIGMFPASSTKPL